MAFVGKTRDIVTPLSSVKGWGAFPGKMPFLLLKVFRLKRSALYGCSRWTKNDA